MMPRSLTILLSALRDSIFRHLWQLTIVGLLAGPPLASIAGVNDVSTTGAFAGTAFERAAHSQGLSPAVLYALAVARTGRTDAHGTAAPWPWTLAERGRVQPFDSRAQAAQALQAPGFGRTPPDLDAGLVGINIGRWGHRVAAAADLLDPTTNLHVAAAILAEGLRATPHDAALAIGRIAYPSDADAARQLGQRVLTIAAALDRAPGVAAASAIRCIGSDQAAAPRVSAGRVPSAAGGPRDVILRIHAAADRHGVDPAFALAIAKNESGFRQAAVSPKGARGVMQLMPGTAARYGADPRDLGQNIEAGVRYLRDLAEQFNGDPALVAAAYNAGEQAVVKHGWRIPPYRETQQYVPRVLAAREQMWLHPQR